MQHLEHTLEQIGSGRIHENLRTFGKVLDQCSGRLHEEVYLSK